MKNIKILFYNIRACTQTSKHIFSPNSLISYFRTDNKILKKIGENILKINPDIVGFVEIDNGSFRTKNQIKEFEKILKMNSASCCKYGWAKKLPFFKNQQISIFSKFKILKTIQHKYSKGFKKIALECVVNINNKDLSIITTHLSLGQNARIKQKEELAKIISKRKKPLVLMGDFNENNQEFKNLKTKKTNTFPSWKPVKQLDYIFNNLEIIKYQSPKWILSDHLPVIMEVKI